MFIRAGTVQQEGLRTEAAGELGGAASVSCWVTGKEQTMMGLFALQNKGPGDRSRGFAAC